VGHECIGKGNVMDEEQPLKMTAGRHDQLADDSDVGNKYLTCGELNAV